MNNEDQIPTEAPAAKPPVAKAVDPEKVDALRRHMLLTVDSFCTLLKVSRVSYYNWLKGKGMRRKMANHIRETVRKLVYCVSNHGWPDGSVFVASQPVRLKMLQALLDRLDNEGEEK